MSVSLFSIRFNELLNEEGLTGYGLKKALGIPMQSILNWQQGIYYPTPKYLLVLMDFFQVSADCLLGLEDDYDENISRNMIPVAFCTKVGCFTVGKLSKG